MIHVAAKLNYKNLNEEVLKHFARLQSKDEQVCCDAIGCLIGTVCSSKSCIIYLALSLPEATIVDHIPWLPLATIGAVFMQYMWAGLSFSWH